MPSMPSKNLLQTVTSAAGFSVGSDGFRNMNPQAMNKYTKTFASFLPMCSADDSMVCVECVETEVHTVTLINQRCTYWPNCKRGDACLFLHEEEPTSTVFHDDNSRSSTQTRTYTVTKTVLKMQAVRDDTPKHSDDEQDDMEVRIYVSNIPGDVRESDLKGMAERFGEVVFVKLLSSSVASGRCAGFVDMMSVRAAVETIAFIKTQRHNDMQLMAKVERKRPLHKKPTKEDKKVDDDGFTTVTSSVSRRGKTTPSPKASVIRSTVFSSLAEEALDEEPPSAVINPAPKASGNSVLRVVAPKKNEPEEEWPVLIKDMAVSPASVMMPWLQTERIDKVRASPITDKLSAMTPRTAPSPINFLPPPFVAPRALMPALITAQSWDPVLDYESWDTDYDRAAFEDDQAVEENDLDIDFGMEATDNWEDRF